MTNSQAEPEERVDRCHGAEWKAKKPEEANLPLAWVLDRHVSHVECLFGQWQSPIR